MHPTLAQKHFKLLDLLTIQILLQPSNDILKMYEFFHANRLSQDCIENRFFLTWGREGQGHYPQSLDHKSTHDWLTNKMGTKVCHLQFVTGEGSPSFRIPASHYYTLSKYLHIHKHIPQWTTTKQKCSHVYNTLRSDSADRHVLVLIFFRFPQTLQCNDFEGVDILFSSSLSLSVFNQKPFDVIDTIQLVSGKCEQNQPHK